MRSLQFLGVTAALAVLSGACQNEPVGKDNNPFAGPSSDIKTPPPAPPPKPSGPPALLIDDIGAKVGFELIVLGKPDSAARLAKALGEVKSELEGKTVTLTVDRRAKLDWVTSYFAALEAIGVERITVKTDSRKDFPQELTFTPSKKLSSPKPCSVIAKVQEDRSTAVWRLSGGTATKHRKGFAGPDLTTTADSLERLGKGCPDSSTLFVAAAPVIDWGLTYDLAASGKALEKVKYDSFVLIESEPVAGRKVEL